MWQENNEDFPRECWVWTLIWSCSFISSRSFSVEEVPDLGLYRITSLFVTLHCMRKLCPGLHCAGKLYPHILERDEKGQVNDTAGVYQLWVFYMRGLGLFSCSELLPAWVPKGADVAGAPVHVHTHRQWRCPSVSTAQSSREGSTWPGH